jgi:hypothetical protein
MPGRLFPFSLPFLLLSLDSLTLCACGWLLVVVDARRKQEKQKMKGEDDI